MSASPESSLLVGEIGDVLWVRVEGRGSFQNSPDLKAVATRAAEVAKHQLVIDLRDCPLMDSTFMGTLTSIALGTRGKPAGRMLVINPNERNLALLENLGLDQIFEVDKSGDALPDLRLAVDSEMLARAQRTTLDKAQHAQHVLQAHEALAGANSANCDRFRDVVTFLKSGAKGNNGPA